MIPTPNAEHDRLLVLGVQTRRAGPRPLGEAPGHRRTSRSGGARGEVGAEDGQQNSRERESSNWSREARPARAGTARAPRLACGGRHRRDTRKRE